MHSRKVKDQICHSDRTIRANSEYNFAITVSLNGNKVEASVNGKKELSSEAKMIIAVSGLTLLNGLNNGWFGPLIPVIAKAQNLPITYASVLVSFCYASSILAMCLGKVMIDTIGLRASSMVSAILMGIGLGVIGVAQGGNILAAGGAALGFGAGLNSITGTTCALKFNTTGSASALNRLNFFFGAGSLVGPIIAWAGTMTLWSYHGIYGLGAIASIGFALFLALSSIHFEKSSSADPSNGDAAATQPLEWRNPILWLYALVNFIYVGLEAAVATYLFVYLSDVLELHAGIASVGMSCVWGGLTAGRLSGMILCKKYSTTIVTAAAMAIAVVSLIVLTMVPLPHYAALVLSAFIGLGYGPIFPNVVATVSNKFPSCSTSAAAAAIIVGAFGGISFPVLMGKVFTSIGMRHAMGMLAVAAAVMLVLFLVLELSTKRKPTSV